MKNCPGCKVVKPAFEFSKCATRYDGLQGECKECCKTRQKKFQASDAGKKYFREAQRDYSNTVRGRAYLLWKSTRKRSSLVTITPEWIAAKLEKGVCEMSGLPLYLGVSTGAGHRHPRSPSLDRIEAKKGYTPENVRLVCWQINLARNCYDDETLFEMCRAISSQGERIRSQGSETIPQGSRAKRSEAPSPERAMI